MRLRITFAKTQEMRFTSHLDLHRTWERTFRRAGLPLAYSQGYSPHPRLNLASALPLGFTGEAEVIDVWLEEEIPPPEIQNALEQSAPPGLQIRSATAIADRAPTLQSLLIASEYTITFLEPVDDLAARINGLLIEKSLPRIRREKTYDLRPLLLELRLLTKDEQGCDRLFAHLAAREGATGRPEEVISALGGDPLASRVHRTRLIFAEHEPLV
jgi:radical SAM-linked protein